MYIKNNTLSIIYKIILLLICLFGQVSSYIISDFGPGILLYYTNISNILCFIYFLFATIYEVKNKEHVKALHHSFAPHIKGAVILAITITMLIYWFVLNSSGFVMSASKETVVTPLINTISNYIVHLVVPLLTIFDWILFDSKGSFKKGDPIRWLLIPLAYYCLMVIIAQTGFRFIGDTRYPYFFIDSDVIGIRNVALFIVGMIAAFLIIGYLIFCLDRLFLFIQNKRR